MSLLFSDGFDSGLTKWAIFNDVSFNPTGGIDGTVGAAYIPSNGTAYFNDAGVQFREPDSINETNPSIRLSFWFKSTGTPTANYGTLRLFGGYAIPPQGIEYEVWTAINTAGKFVINYFDDAFSGGVARVTSTTNVADGNWHHIEIYYKLGNGTSGAYSLAIDGVVEGINLAADTCISSTSPTVGFTCFNGLQFSNLVGADYYIDDLIIWDDYSESYNDFLGPQKMIKIRTLRPDSGTGYEDINEPEANTVNSVSILESGSYFSFEDYTSAGNSAYALTINTLSTANISGYTTNTTVQLYDGSTYANIANVSHISSNNIIMNSVSLTKDPFINISWNENLINNLQVGMKVTR